MNLFSRPALLALVAMSLGCSDASPRAASAPPNPSTSRTTSRPNSTKARPKSEPRVKVTADMFPSVPVAVEALRAGLVEHDKDAVWKAEGWLALQQEKAVGPLTQVVRSEESSAELRITACRALGRVGPAATQVLVETTQSETLPEQLKVKATESLSLVRPTSPAIVERLQEIARSGDLRMRQVAIQGLGRLGPAAKAATELLVGLLNDTSENETIRGEAQRALKEVDPRRGLMGLASPQK